MGVFATRSPFRPNPIGLTSVRLLQVADGELIVSGADLMDGTPIYDIKPYVSYSDCHADSQDGFADAHRDDRLDVSLLRELAYILEQAARVWEEDYTLMRPLVFDFPQDDEALRQDCEWMFGPDYLVCPVTEGEVSSWTVYLPENGPGWEDIRTGAVLDGGQYAVVPVDLDAIPVFRRMR